MSGFGFVASSSAYDDEDRGIGFQLVVQNRTHNPPHELLTVSSQSVTHDANVARHSVSEFATEIYFQDGQQTIADYPSGTAAGSPSYTYVDASHIDEPVMRGGSGGLRYYHRNQQYSINAVSDGGGAIVERYAYSAYGQVTMADASGSVISDSAIANRYTYTGREWDEGLSLYHYRGRMYDAAGGRFVSRDPIDYYDYYSLYYAGFAVKRTDPTGLSDFIHPDNIDSLDACDQWERERIAGCYELLGWVVNQAFLDCLNAVRQAAERCRNRNIDDTLRGVLNTSCCDVQPTEHEREACYAEASQIMSAVQAARAEIYRLGGPARFSFQGPVCTTCQGIVQKELPKAARRYFIYETRAATAGLPVGIPGFDHCWGQLYCKGEGERRYGQVLVTIDFWIGGKNYWREGEGSFGW